jgi:putative Ca2+/H+ antiporter (TMEM165/GDT1 family)
MDWKVFTTAFVTVFLAELGDKTQLAALTLATGRGRLAVFLGASLALVCTTALAVVAAEGITRVVSPVTLKRLAGAMFVLLGAWTLATASRA